MSLVVNTNLPALNAQRNLTKSQGSLQTSLQRLSSGLRINSAKDDAAGLALSNRMASQIRGLNQAVRNANDGISLAQTAEGALSESTNILQRMRELAIESANGIYSDGDRSKLNDEFTQLNQELNRIAKTTSFNGQPILDGSLKSVDLQVGDQANQIITLKIQAVDTKTLGMGSVSVDMMSGESNLAALTGAAAALGENDVLINGQSVLKSGQTFDGATDTTGKLIDYINTNVNGVTASTYTQVKATGAGTGALLAGTDTLTVTMTKLDNTTTAFTITDTGSLQEIADKLNEQSGGLLSVTVGDDNKLVIAANDSASLTVAGSTPAALANTGLSAATTQANLILTSDHGDPITVTRGATGTVADLSALGFRENTLSGVVQGNSLLPGASATPLGVGDLTINGVAIDVTNTGSLQGKVAAINAVQQDTSVTATAFSSAEIETSGALLTGGTFDLNGSPVLITVPTLQGLVDGFNAATSSTGVTARVLGSRVVLEGDVASLNFGAGTTGVFGASTLAAAGQPAAAITNASVVDGGIKLSSSNGNPISVDVSAAGAASTGLVDANATADGSFGTAIAQTSIDTVSHATKSLAVIDKALDTINDIRAGLGAVSNRLDFTISNLSNIVENASAAQSRIMDADFAAETANMTKNQILQQAGISILSQANSLPQQVLSLLK
jgi:flagellin